MTAHNRACIIEVMGRKCGDIAVYAGLAGGAEIILVPEIPMDLNKVCTTIRQDKIKGKNSVIIILAEGVCTCAELKEKILEQVTDLSIRTVKLGYLQRGGTPSMADRILAARCGMRAVELLKNGDCGGRVVGIKNNRIISVVALHFPGNPVKLNTLNSLKIFIISFAHLLTCSDIVIHMAEIAQPHSRAELIHLSIGSDGAYLLRSVNSEVFKIIDLLSHLIVSVADAAAFY